MAKKSTKAKKPRRYVPRQTRKFQLRLDHPADLHVSQVLDHARTQRREVTMIREGVALLWALENGELEYLFEKFPQYRAHFNPDHQNLIEQFRQMLQQGRAESSEFPSGAKLLNAPKIALPLLDDDDEQDTLVIKKDASANASMNFLSKLNTV